MEGTTMKKTRILLALTIALAMCLSIAPMALATQTDPVTEAAITKLLMVPEGTEYPAMDFYFTLTPESYNGSKEAQTVADKVPVITGTGPDGEIVIGFDGATAVGRSEELESTVANVSTYYKESADLFDGVTFPNAGIYEYIVEESDTSHGISSRIREAMIMSPAKYLLTVFVRELDGVTYIYHIGVVRTIKEDGTPGTDKVDPTPGSEQEEFLYGQMLFVNKYVSTNGAVDPNNPDPKKPDPDNPEPGDSTLNIIKTVTGDLGSTILPFNFTLTINVPTLIPEFVLGYYNAYLVNNSGIVDPTGTISGAAIGTDGSGNKYIRVISGSPVAFELTDGQALVFVNTPVGTTFSATETAAIGYDTSVTVWNNSVKGMSLTALSAAGLVGELYNAADYVNDFPDPTPGGLNVNDFPFYGLILLAIGGLVLFIVIKTRKSNKE